jgi:hypothetical protein
VFRTTFQLNKISDKFLGDLLQLAHTHVLAVHFEVNISNGPDKVTRVFRAVYELLAFPMKIFPAMMSSYCLGVPL